MSYEWSDEHESNNPYGKGKGKRKTTPMQLSELPNAKHFPPPPMVASVAINDTPRELTPRECESLRHSEDAARAMLAICARDTANTSATPIDATRDALSETIARLIRINYALYLVEQEQAETAAAVVRAIGKEPWTQK